MTSVEFDAGPDTRPRPFDGTGVDRVTTKRAVELLGADVVYGVGYGGSVSVVDRWVAGHYAFPPSAVFIVADHLTTPVVFAANVAGRRAYVVAAREYGDLSWPAYLRKARKDAAADTVRLLREGFAGIRAQLDPRYAP